MNIRALFLAGAILAVGSLTADAQTFSIRKSVIGSGGGPVSGGAYSMNGTIGQPVIGPTGSSTGFQANQGFWYGSTKPTGGVESHQTGLPNGFALQQNYPNPFNPSTSIRFSVPERMKVTLRVMNLLGEEVARVIDQESYAAGTWQVDFNAKDLPSGTYIYRLEAGSSTLSKKMVLMK